MKYQCNLKILPIDGFGKKKKINEEVNRNTQEKIKKIICDQWNTQSLYI